MTDLIRRNMMMAASADEIIIDAVKGGVSGDAANDAALMKVIHAQGWSKSPLYMTKKEAEKVEDIGQAFRNNDYIRDFNAFEYFTSVTSIPSYAFGNNGYLSTIKFPTSLSKINSNALESCINLTKIDLPDSLQQIGYRAFRATAITSLYIPDNVTFIDEGIIAHCQNVTSLIVSPNNTKYYSGEYNAIIEKDTHKFIMGCNTSTIPSDTKVIGKSAFNGIPITQIILPSGLEEIENSAFSQCKVTELIIPSSVRKIGSSAFWNNNFTSLILPYGLVRIETNLVSNSANLTSLYIPASVTFIGNGCIQQCKKLTTINFGGTMSQWKSISKGHNWNYNVPTDCVVYCTDGDLNITE